MALPTSGPLTLAQIQTEFGGSNPISLSEYYAGGANVPSGTSGTNGPVPSSGQIAISNFYGTQKNTRVTISYTFSAHTANASLNLSSISGYSAGQSDITVTINSGIYLYSTSTGSYGLNLSGGTTGDTLTVVNNGYIMGQGGNGGSGFNAGSAGGPALNLGFGMSSCTINNTNGSAYIAGGGGGGGGGNAGASPLIPQVAGGGGGGAGGGTGGSSSSGSAGGAGGSIGSSGGTPVSGRQGGGGGGRILPGSGGAGGDTSTLRGYGGGSGGGGATSNAISGKTQYYGTGGAGGSANAAGTAVGYAAANPRGGGGGGGWGASGGASEGAAGSGGKAVNLNGKSITWTSGNTTRVYGAVS